MTVLPGTTTAAELAELHPDGLMLSNGPGDPAENVDIIDQHPQKLSAGRCPCSASAWATS